MWNEARVTLAPCALTDSDLKQLAGSVLIPNPSEDFFLMSGVEKDVRSCTRLSRRSGRRDILVLSHSHNRITASIRPHHPSSTVSSPSSINPRRRHCLSQTITRFAVAPCERRSHGSRHQTTGTVCNTSSPKNPQKEIRLSLRLCTPSAQKLQPQRVRLPLLFPSSSSTLPLHLLYFLSTSSSFPFSLSPPPLPPGAKNTYECRQTETQIESDDEDVYENAQTIFQKKEDSEESQDSDNDYMNVDADGQRSDEDDDYHNVEADEEKHDMDNDYEDEIYANCEV
ncbi:hypothetical protein Baya_11538 [Bagarius yarrelli]|uniref:Uncharacterized protein n=1 Tax=Bagarius yarrelli TaxID=175774 RepID=A0A556UZK2_BAGYA|nr:hypothetical protein Baya_11538 [Bagarius yarrelli]